MQRILFPTDFSPAAKNAFLYAVRIAQLFGSQITVVHCYAPSFDPHQPMAQQPIEESRQVVEERLKKFIQIYPDQTPNEGLLKIKVTYENLIGFATDEIVRISKEEDYDLIIMATTGSHGLLDKIFGSVSSACSRHAHCPVLLVPKDVSYKPYRNILYATNYDSSTDVLIQRLLQFARMFSSNVHFVHVVTDGRDSFQMGEAVFQRVLEDKAPGIAFRFSAVKGKSVIEGIEQYTHDYHIDLVVFATRRRNFWENLIHKSQTKRMALNTELPLLVMHIDE